MSRSMPPKIRLIGNALIDLVMQLPRWPGQDEELRALGFERRCGGNAANTALRLARAGCSVQLVASLAADSEGEWLRRRLLAEGIDLAPSPIIEQGQTPFSSVWLVESAATRAIVHYRDLPELEPELLRRLDHTGWDWLHLEGRNVAGLRALLPARGIDRDRCSLELEKPREGLEDLLERVGCAILSAAWLEQRGERPETAVQRLQQRYPHLRLVLTRGADGVCLAEPGSPPRWLEPPRRLDQGDSLGAGDGFIAGLIAALASGQSLVAAAQQGQRWALEQISGAGS